MGEGRRRGRSCTCNRGSKVRKGRRWRRSCTCNTGSKVRKGGGGGGAVLVPQLVTSSKVREGRRWRTGLHKIFFVLYPKFFQVKLSYRAPKLKYIKTRQKYVYYVLCLMSFTLNVLCLLFYVL